MELETAVAAYQEVTEVRIVSYPAMKLTKDP